MIPINYTIAELRGVAGGGELGGPVPHLAGAASLPRDPVLCLLWTQGSLARFKERQNIFKPPHYMDGFQKS